MFQKLKELSKGHEKIIIISVVCICILGYFLWGLYGRADVPDLRDGADRVTTGLEATQDQQRATTDSIGTVETGLTKVADTARRSTQQLDEARTTNTRIIERSAESESSVRTSGEIISRLETRFQTIRERGKQ